MQSGSTKQETVGSAFQTQNLAASLYLWAPELNTIILAFWLFSPPPSLLPPRPHKQIPCGKWPSEQSFDKVSVHIASLPCPALLGGSQFPQDLSVDQKVLQSYITTLQRVLMSIYTLLPALLCPSPPHTIHLHWLSCPTDITGLLFTHNCMGSPSLLSSLCSNFITPVKPHPNQSISSASFLSVSLSRPCPAWYFFCVSY